MTTPRRLRALCLVMTLAALSALTPGQVDLKDAPARATAELKASVEESAIAVAPPKKKLLFASDPNPSDPNPSDPNPCSPPPPAAPPPRTPGYNVTWTEFKKTVPGDMVSKEDVSEIWGFLNFNELVPPRVVSKRSPAMYRPFVDDLMDDFINNFTFNIPACVDNGIATFGCAYDGNEELEFTIPDILGLTATDAAVILYKGKKIYEAYLHQSSYSRHRLFSATKSYIGIMAAMMVNNATGGLKDTDYVTDIIPEMKGTGLDGATVRHLMDMTADFKWTEGGPGLQTEVTSAYLNNLPYPLVEGTEFGVQYQFATKLWDHPLPEWMSSSVFGLPPESSDTGIFRNMLASGPNMREYLTLLKDGSREHGTDWTYRTANTDILAWVLDKKLVCGENNGCDTSGQPSAISDYFEEHLWSKLGQGADFFISVDDAHVPYWGAGGMATLEDFARFGLMLFNGGKNQDGQEVVPEAVTDDLRNPPLEIFEMPFFQEYGYAYHNQMWVVRDGFDSEGNPRCIYIQKGYFGQYVINIPHLDIVFAKFSRHDEFQGEYERILIGGLVELGKGLGS